jgi:hypothetical protein
MNQTCKKKIENKTNHSLDQILPFQGSKETKTKETAKNSYAHKTEKTLLIPALRKPIN